MPTIMQTTYVVKILVLFFDINGFRVAPPYLITLVSLATTSLSEYTQSYLYIVSAKYGT